MFLVKPGTPSKLLLLTDVLREQHEEHRKRVQKDQALRKASGAPLTDDGSPPPVIDEYEAPEHLDGVQVVFRVVSDSDRQRLFGLVRQAAGDGEAMQKAFREVLQCVLQAIQCGDEVHAAFGDETAEAWSKGFLQLLADNMLLVPLSDAALHFLSLPPKKALRCGQPAQLTSGPTSAPAAESSSDESVDVTGELEPAIFVAPITRPTPVHAGT